MSDPIQPSNIQIGLHGTEVCWCSCQAASPAGVSTALPKVNPLVICFTAAQTQGVVSGKPIIIRHESGGKEVPRDHFLYY